LWYFVHAFFDFFIKNRALMVRYKAKAQLDLEGFDTTFSQKLSANNRWVHLAQMIPWDKLADVYYRKMRAKLGPPTLDARMVIGAVIIKHLLNIDDREVVQQITENMYLQYFVGLTGFQKDPPFDPSLMVRIRKRLGKEAMDELNLIILREAGVLKDQVRKKNNDGPDNGQDGSLGQRGEGEDKTDEAPDSEPSPGELRQGTLLVDATVAEQQIAYPTDLNLLGESRENLERMVRKASAVMGMNTPRMYSEMARKKYLTVAKSKRKSHSALRRGIREQLQYVKRDLRYMDGLVQYSEMVRLSLEERDWKLLRVIHELYRQQRWMYKNEVHSIADRIVSLHQPHVRPMPRGKDRASTEFGSKQLLMLRDGYSHLCKLDWDNFHDGAILDQALEKYRQVYGCYPERVLGDRLYGNRENRQLLKEKGIRFVGRALGRRSAQQKQEEKLLIKEMAERNAIEGKIGQGKNGYGLAKIKARLRETSESWISAIYLVMNLVKLLQKQLLRHYAIAVYLLDMIVMKLKVALLQKSNIGSPIPIEMNC
jgi:transposase, IS5 family